MSVCTRLLNAAGCGDKNIAALTSVMDLETVAVKCSLLEMDAWRNICVKSDVIKTLQFRWDPHCHSLTEEKVENFFRQLLTHNKGIENVKMEFFHGEVKSTQIAEKTFREYLLEEVKYFGQYISMCMRKNGLKSLTINLRIIGPQECEEIREQISSIVIQNIGQVFNVMSRDLSLLELKLDLDLGTQQLVELVEAVKDVNSLKKLALFKVSSELRGFQSLAELIVQGNILELELSLNMTKYWRSIATAMKRDLNVCVGSPEMFKYPLHNLGKAVFEDTLQKDIPYSNTDNANDGEESMQKLQNLLLELGKWVSSKPDEVLGLHEAEFYYTTVNNVILPLPLCSGHGGKESGFCTVFGALRDPRCRLQSFHLNRCLLSQETEYLCCLAEVLAQNSTLTKLKVDNMVPATSHHRAPYTTVQLETNKRTKVSRSRRRPSTG